MMSIIMRTIMLHCQLSLCASSDVVANDDGAAMATSEQLSMRARHYVEEFELNPTPQELLQTLNVLSTRHSAAEWLAGLPRTLLSPIPE